MKIAVFESNTAFFEEIQDYLGEAFSLIFSSEILEDADVFITTERYFCLLKEIKKPLLVFSRNLNFSSESNVVALPTGAYERLEQVLYSLQEGFKDSDFLWQNAFLQNHQEEIPLNSYWTKISSEKSSFKKLISLLKNLPLEEEIKKQSSLILYEIGSQIAKNAIFVTLQIWKDCFEMSVENYFLKESPFFARAAGVKVSKLDPAKIVCFSWDRKSAAV